MFGLLLWLLSQIKIAKDGRYYVVANGKAHFLKKEVILPERPKAIHTNQRVGGIYHYIRTHQELGQVRQITNNPLMANQRKCEESIATGMPVDGLFAINSGDWLPWLMIKRLHEKNVRFTLTIVKNGVINPPRMATKQEWAEFHSSWEDKVNKCQFAWANSGNTYFLQLPDYPEWGLKVLGLEILDSPKAAKRLNEVVRTTKLAWYTEDKDEIQAIRIKIRKPQGLSSKARDGMTYVTKSFMQRLTWLMPDQQDAEQIRRDIASGKEKRYIVRMLIPPGMLPMFPEGCLLKGDLIARPDAALNGYDIVTVPENLKVELRPTGQWFMVTAFEHDPVHESTWDIQRMVMNPQILTNAHRKRDLTRFVEEIKTSIEEGVLPEWLLKNGNESFGDEGKMGDEREAYKDHDEVPLRWQIAGFDIRCAQNVVRMSMGAILGRMAKFFDGGYHQGEAKGYSKAMYLPKSNAVTLGIITHGSLTKIGNYKTRYRGDKAWYAPGIGLVIPDRRFDEGVCTLTGGSDFDDTVEVSLVRIWSSDASATEMMARNGVIGRNELIPTSRSEAKIVGAILRSPNGIGEYSFLELEDVDKFPIQLWDLDHLTTVDLAKLPLPQQEALKKVKLASIPSSLQYSKLPINRKTALAQIKAQQFNPGIGQVANTIMAWAAVAGPSMPPSLGAPFEELVDGAQQLSDPAIFKAIRAIGPAVSEDAIIHLKVNKGTVDRYMIPRFVGLDKVAAQSYAVDGPMTEFQEMYREAIKDLYVQVERRSLQMRQAQPMVQWAKELNFSIEAKNWASEFNARYTGKLSLVDGKYAGVIKDAYGLQKIVLQRRKHAETRQVINEAVAEINSSEKPGQRALALWAYLVRPTPTNKHGVTDKPLGHYDRLVFQQGDGVSIMDILIPVLHSRGWGTESTEVHESAFPMVEDPEEGYDIDGDVWAYLED